MDAIVAVYSDWGIGRKGTQPVVLKADRAHFRELTAGAAVIVGRKTLEDFPGGRPLKGRFNIVITAQDLDIPGAVVVHGIDEAITEAAAHDRCLVLGGAGVFRQFFPYLDRIYLTQIDLAPESDSFFPKLDEQPDWFCSSAGDWQEEDGIRYRFCTYERTAQSSEVNHRG